MAETRKRPFWDGQRMHKRGEVIGESQVAEAPVEEGTDEKKADDQKALDLDLKKTEKK